MSVWAFLVRVRGIRLSPPRAAAARGRGCWC